jgi:hypothetical protein
MLKPGKIKSYLFCLFISFSVVGYGSDFHEKDKTSDGNKKTGFVNPFIRTSAANVRLKYINHSDITHGGIWSISFGKQANE